jgi:hypothetical protein
MWEVGFPPPPVEFSSHRHFYKLSLLQAFPLLIAGCVLLLLPASVFILQLTWEVGLPLSLVEFSSLCHSHKLSHSWLLGVHPCSHWSLSGQARLVYLQFWEGVPSPLFGAQGALPSLPCAFIVLIGYYSVSLFSPGGGWSVQGAMLFWPRVVCGGTTHHLTHLVHVFLSHLGMGDWGPGGPPGFSL